MGTFRTSRELERACEADDAGAQMLMAGLYLLGKGVPPDAGEAYYWLLRAKAPQRDLMAVASLLESKIIRTIELRLALAQESSQENRAAWRALLTEDLEVEPYVTQQKTDLPV